MSVVVCAVGEIDAVFFVPGVRRQLHGAGESPHSASSEQPAELHSQETLCPSAQPQDFEFEEQQHQVSQSQCIK